MITTIFLNFFYLGFPLLFYFLYLVYSEVFSEKEKRIFLDLTLFSSFYVCSRFGNLTPALAFLINIPLLLSLYKKRYVTSIILAFTTASYLSNIYEISLIAFLFQYVIILLVCYFTSLKKENIFVGIKILFGSFLMIFMPERFSLTKIFWLLIIWLLMYLCFILIIKVYNKMENIVKMHNSLQEITREKTLYQSLFKITHEIKNPLAVCKGYLEMFDIRNVGKANKYINIIDQEINRTLELLKDFSDVSKLSIEKDTMSINMLLEDACDTIKIIFNNNTIFNYIIDEEEVEINGDYNRLKQVLINVIKNAKEALENNGGVYLKSKKTKNSYIIIIEDNGVGMDKKSLNNLGKPFYTSKKNGTGLGVCFSKEIVERHGGSIKYYSKKDKGTKVIIKLPI